MTGPTKESIEKVAELCGMSISWVQKRLDDGWIFHNSAPDRWSWIIPKE